jgi:hypothetical protein
MVVELLLRVGHGQIFYETIVSEREYLKSFHGKEQPGNTFEKNNPPSWRANVIIVSTRVPSKTPF